MTCDEVKKKVATNTGHGHVWDRPDGRKARCGGPGICDPCSRDLAWLTQQASHCEVAQETKVEFDKQERPDDVQE